MPVIFHKHERQWHTLSISSQAGSFALDLARFDASGRPSADPSDVACLVLGDGRGLWVLLVPAGGRLLHNGEIVTPGADIRVLAHMDCLSLDGGEPVYFSTEETARIEPFAGSTAVTCPRCRSEVHPGQAAVKCPRCGVFHHETEDRNCFTYATTCAVCAQPTALDAGLQWTPAAL